MVQTILRRGFRQFPATITETLIHSPKTIHFSSSWSILTLSLANIVVTKTNTTASYAKVGASFTNRAASLAKVSASFAISTASYANVGASFANITASFAKVGASFAISTTSKPNSLTSCHIINSAGDIIECAGSIEPSASYTTCPNTMNRELTTAVIPSKLAFTFIETPVN